MMEQKEGPQKPLEGFSKDRQWPADVAKNKEPRPETAQAQYDALVEKVRQQAGNEKAEAVKAKLAEYATADCAKGSGGSTAGHIGANQLNAMVSRAPEVGEIVLVDLGKAENGTRIHPGIVTRAWGPHCINVRVFADAGNDYQYNSVMHKSQTPPASSYEQPRPLYWYRRYEGGPID